MEVTYIRNMNGSYLQFLEKEQEVDVCCERMQLSNHIYGLLPVTVANIDGSRLYEYEITGRQALDVLLEHRLLDEQLFVDLLVAISGITERMESYLLLHQQLLLLPEFIFRDYETGAFWFCCYPGKIEGKEDGFLRFAEYLLTKIDHKQERVVTLAYQLYEEVLKEGYSLSLIRNKLKFIKAAEDVAVETREEQQEEVNVEDTNLQRKLSLEKNETLKMGAEESETGKLQIEKIRHRIAQTAEKWKQKKINIQNKWVFAPKKLQMKRNGKKNEEPFVFEPEPEEESFGNPTTLLLSKEGEPEGILKYIGNHGLSDFKIETLPFLIGSDASCSGILEQSTISRMHARITKTENVYYIEDLNSSNGTRIDGMELPYKEKVVLKTNEIIEFADEKFRFI